VDGEGMGGKLQPLLKQLLDEGGFSLSELERSAYQAAVGRARGNLSAAARLLGLTRPQLAYRLGTRNDPA
jgi:transcriptional regulator with AAA-type ATPase domain